MAIPTDTVYGLAVVPSLSEAVDRLFGLKERPRDVAVPVLVATWRDVGAVAGQLDGRRRAAGRSVLARTADTGRPPVR